MKPQKSGFFANATNPRLQLFAVDDSGTPQKTTYRNPELIDLIDASAEGVRQHLREQPMQETVKAKLSKGYDFIDENGKLRNDAPLTVDVPVANTVDYLRGKPPVT